MLKKSGNFVNKIVKSKRIKKDLVKYAMLFDPLVDKNFYCRKLKELSIDHYKTETLFENVGRDMFSLMALLRGHQIGLIDKKFIDNIILQPTDVKWLINRVQIELHRLLRLDEIKIMCHGNQNLYELAAKKRMHGWNYEKFVILFKFSVVI